MARIGTTFVCLCMIAAAAGIAALSVQMLGAAPATGALTGVAALAALAPIPIMLANARAWRRHAARLEAIGEHIIGLARRVETLEPRLRALEATTAEALKRKLPPVTEDIVELGALVRQVAEQVAAQETAIAEFVVTQRTRDSFGPPRPVTIEPAPAPAVAPGPAPDTPPVLPPVPPPLPARLTADHAARLTSALERGAIEILLRPIVSLPQRRTIHYQALARLRDEDERVIEPADAAGAEIGGSLLRALDALTLDRTLRIARRLRERQREAALFVGLSPGTVAADSFAADIARRLDANAELAPHIVLSFGQAAFRDFGTLETELLASIHERGFRFALEAAGDLAFDPRALHQTGVRFVSVPSRLLLQADAAGAEIHPADLPGLFRRHGMLLIADDVATEASVPDLLDIDLQAARGDLFGGARPVRPEIFEEAAATPSPAVPAEAMPAVRTIARSA